MYLSNAEISKAARTPLLVSKSFCTMHRLFEGISRWLRMLGTIASITGLALVGAPAHADQPIVVPLHYPTIQAAVDAAPSGATIHVRGGTFVEEVVITKHLTIKGEGADRTVIRAPAVLTSFGQHLFNLRPLAAIIRVTDGAQVRMSGVTVSGPIPCAVNTGGIRAVKGATLDLTESRITLIRHADTSCDPQGTVSSGIVIGLPSFIQIDGEAEGGSTAHGRVTRTRVDRFFATGIAILGPFGGAPSTATVSGNLIDGGTPFIQLSQTGISVNFASIARVTENTVRATACTDPACGRDPINQFQAVGLSASSLESSGTQFKENTVIGSDVGIYLFGGSNCCETRENTLRDNRYFGIVIQDGDQTTSQNRISGGEVGIGVVADAIDVTATLRGDRIRGTTVQQVQEISCCGFTATAVVQTP
jgi:parallel beta-helix repeat protein